MKNVGHHEEDGIPITNVGNDCTGDGSPIDNCPPEPGIENLLDPTLFLEFYFELFGNRLCRSFSRALDFRPA
jgi:hypothetical protein